MKVPAELLYTREHEWVLVDGDTATIGITDFAQQELGDVVYVELPEKGDSLEVEESFGSVESVKAVSEIYMPLSGSILATNEALVDGPEIVNQDPYGAGWMIKLSISDSDQIGELMSADDYEKYLSEEGD